jgi:tetratricopeptide (TPR) repeat protein
MALLHGPTPVAAAVDRAEELLGGAGGNPLLQANVLSALAELKAMQSSFEEARELYVRAQGIYESLGLRLALAGVMQVGGALELWAGDAAASERILREGHAILVGLTGWHGFHGLLLAEALYDQARYAEAEELVDAADALSRSTEVEAQVSWSAIKGPLLARRGESVEAERLVREALSLIEVTDALNLHARTLASLGEVLQLGGADEATNVARKAISLFQQKGNVAAAERTAALLRDLAARRPTRA